MPSWDNVPSGTMRAALLTSPCSSPPGACFTYVTDYPKPSLPNPDWVLVRVYATGLNRAELRARNAEPVSPYEFGIFMDEFHNNCPKVIGEEFVGEIVEAGKNTPFKVGERVVSWAYGGGKAYDGSYAEYTICHKSRIWKLGEASKDVEWEVLAAIAMGLWTAYGSIFVAADTKPGDIVFIHGATSSVGIWGVLAAKNEGCTVIASTRQERKIQNLKDAGADYVVLEKDLASPETIRKIAPNGVNTVLELIGLEVVETISMPALAIGGTCVKSGILGNAWELKVTPAIAPPMKKLTSFTTMNVHFDESQKVLIDAIEKVRSGVYRKEDFLDSVFDLQDVGAAHQRMEDNAATGKVVLRIP